MPKVFNTAAICIPQEHYMVNLDSRVREIKKLVDAGKYFMKKIDKSVKMYNIASGEDVEKVVGELTN